MSGTVLNPFERLRTLLVEARQAIEQAEARVEQFNELLRGLSQQGEVPRGFFLGKTIASPWDAEAGRCSAGHVIQAVLLVPEGLGEQVIRADDGLHGHEEDDRPQLRDGDVPENTDRIGAVDARRFHQFFRDVLQAGQEIHRIDAHVGPDAQQDKRGHRPGGGLDPGDPWDTDDAQGGVQ